MAVLAIEWQINQCLVLPEVTNWDQAMEHFLKSLRDFCTYFCEVYIHGMFWP